MPDYSTARLIADRPSPAKGRPRLVELTLLWQQLLATRAGGAVIIDLYAGETRQRACARVAGRLTKISNRSGYKLHCCTTETTIAMWLDESTT